MGAVTSRLDCGLVSRCKLEGSGQAKALERNHRHPPAPAPREGEMRMQGSYCSVGGEKALNSVQSQGGEKCPSSIFSCPTHIWTATDWILCQEDNLVTQVSSPVRIDFNASILVVALGFLKKSSCASLFLHPFPFPWDPAFSPSPNHKRPCRSQHQHDAPPPPRTSQCCRERRGAQTGTRLGGV